MATKQHVDRGASLIELFTTPCCPDCLALKAWLSRQRIAFVEHDLTNRGVADEVRRRAAEEPPALFAERTFYCSSLGGAEPEENAATTLANLQIAAWTGRYCCYRNPEAFARRVAPARVTFDPRRDPGPVRFVRSFREALLSFIIERPRQ